ncbi:MAG: aspartyl protease family protein [Alphaproteobacteria bacterium]|nr:aspartyl protease family protein [Alphaproteobacteria bacterium]
MRIAVVALSLMAASGLTGAQARSGPCRPLQEIASLKMTILPDGSRVSVPLTINGRRVEMLVDTGTGMSSLTKPAAAMLDVKKRNSAAVHLVDKDGARVSGYYVADNFQVGKLTGRDQPFLQDINSEATQIAGAIGPDLMVRYDVEMDFAGQKLIYFSQDHCPAHILHWSSDAVTQVPISIRERVKDYPPAMLPGAALNMPQDILQGMIARAGASILGTDIRTKVMLDGHEFTANIDTGLDTSTINSKAARDTFGVALEDRKPDTSAAQPDQPVPAGVETVTVTGLRQQHRFHNLAFGGVTVVNPLFVVRPVDMGVRKAGDPKLPDITIGMNVLSKLHLYFAFGEHMLYVSAASSRTQ